jgi:hypothetical protein
VFAVLFFVAVVWSRLDFTITKDKAYHASIAREKARGVLQELQAAWEGEQLLKTLLDSGVSYVGGTCIQGVESG